MGKSGDDADDDERYAGDAAGKQGKRTGPDRFNNETCELGGRWANSKPIKDAA